MAHKKILITGGAGFIGSNLVHHLAKSSSHDLLVLDNLSVGLSAVSLPARAKFVEGDFTSKTVLTECLRGIDTVVHLAALSGVIDSIADPGPSFAVNVAGTFQLLDLARKAGIKKIICASSGGALLGNVTPPISETMSPSPLSPYGASKLAVEGYCSAFAGAYGLGCVSLRFSNIYGQRSSHKKSVVAAFIKQAIRGEPLIVYGDGAQQRDYLYVGDLVRGIEIAIDREIAGTYQLGSGKPTSLRQLIAVLNVVAGHELEVLFNPARRGEVHATWCNIAKAAHDLDFSAPTYLDTGLRATWDWFAENRKMWENNIALTASD